ncbi:Glycosyltransferase involved in cell wall bisynthesis [Eubacterium ruminantium]|nr:Glycosyltransferase involved in cell wall bisynthesis [Eubacterium ruminantium]
MINGVWIIYNKLVDDQLQLTIGGIQSYILNLIEVCKEYGAKNITVCQAAGRDFEVEFPDFHIIGVKGSVSGRRLVDHIEKNKNPDYENDLLIFATDFLICKNRFRKSVAVQHGIAFDGTTDFAVSNFENLKTIVKNVFRSVLKYSRFKNCNNIVCVDYNFLNWYRTQVRHIDSDFYVIPNFSKLIEVPTRKTDGIIKIIFARRLEIYRGTRLFPEAIKPLLDKYKNISVTIAGTGPDEKWIKEQLSKYSNVTFTTYKSEESLEIHSKYDIAVIPTKYSEGTSLSLLEAMAAGCATVCTNVGGMTNIVLDGFNGLMVRPVAEEIRDAIEELIINHEKRQYLASNGRLTVEKSFSYEKWKNSWEKLLSAVENEPYGSKIKR